MFTYSWTLLFSACPKCVPSKDGLTCCGIGGSWRGKCGLPSDSRFEYTWKEGVRACQGASITVELDGQPTQKKVTSAPQTKGGAVILFAAIQHWHFLFIIISTSCYDLNIVKPCTFCRFPVCDTCVPAEGEGGLTCCGTGGSWEGKCGIPGNTKFEHTWSEGKKACIAAATPSERPPQFVKGGVCFRYCVKLEILLFVKKTKDCFYFRTTLLPLVSACPKCGPSKDGLTCCGKGGSWRRKCGTVASGRQYTWTEGLRVCGNPPKVVEERTLPGSIIPIYMWDNV